VAKPLLPDNKVWSPNVDAQRSRLESLFERPSLTTGTVIRGSRPRWCESSSGGKPQADGFRYARIPRRGKANRAILAGPTPHGHEPPRCLHSAPEQMQRSQQPEPGHQDRNDDEPCELETLVEQMNEVNVDRKKASVNASECYTLEFLGTSEQ